MALSSTRRRNWAIKRSFHAGNIDVLDAVEIAVDSATVIAVGDLIWLNTDDARPASMQADGGSLAANQETFHDNFAGVALEASAVGETDPILVATDFYWQVPCASATFNVGDLIGAVEKGNGTQLEDQKVVGVATANLAIGRVAKAGVSVVSVLVRGISTVLYGGPQSMI